LRDRTIRFDHCVKYYSSLLVIGAGTAGITRLNAAYQLRFLHIIALCPKFCVHRHIEQRWIFFGDLCNFQYSYSRNGSPILQSADFIGNKLSTRGIECTVFDSRDLGGVVVFTSRIFNACDGAVCLIEAIRSVPADHFTSVHCCPRNTLAILFVSYQCHRQITYTW
jgi:hypothetical protein